MLTALYGYFIVVTAVMMTDLDDIADFDH